MFRRDSIIGYFLIRITALILIGIYPFQAIAEENNLPYYTLLDSNTGHVIAENNPDKLWNPASLTKLMTAYVAFSFLEQKKITLETPITISKNASEQPPSNSTFKKGSILTLDNALKLLIVKSANDIAVAIAESLCNTEEEFVKHMNNSAQTLGLLRTKFMNSHGVVQNGHYTTARDMTILSWRIKTHFPEYAHYFQIKGLKIKNKKYPNTNWAIGIFLGADGMKTGFTCASGFNIVASASQGNRSLITVVLGALDRDSRNRISEKLLSTGFDKKKYRNKINYIIKKYDKKNFSIKVPDISEKVCTPKNEITNFNTQIKETKDKEKYFTNFETITLFKKSKRIT
ncbi:D-alanyl-D-alanine carboxypeptidase family protein [Candidatus Liberibacter solanacearum]|uniref:Peptidase S11 n=1 Tax=Candidatus Liberibacter solanacearum TaxID=556287 RepID=A0A1V2N825_9HYPH|nr:D-alanyl-D-alanine carboxypeptidase family protein [Candidatus Liberibacter solanacearum]ONI59221.1 peptidase S11 [Candidatus Liberibacter solanacearum]ONI59709.1 peptidase S11 [Candidatus Liberibacter solanacearum]